MARALNFIPSSFALCFALFSMVAACGDDTRTPINACNPACAAGLTCCNGACVATQTRADHCGMCGNVCAAGSTCAAGVCSGGPTMDGSVMPMPDSSVPSMCMPTCSADERCCGTTCFDRAAPAGQLDARTHESFLNCNGCGLGCDMDRASRCGAPAAGGAAQCLCGNTSQCPVGQACVQRAGNYLCADLRFDRDNCGEVGRVCAEGESCTNGMCGCGAGPACAAGQACCGSACIDTSSDAMNCGGCGTVCGPNAPNCNSGSCGCGSGPACAAPVAGVFGMGGMPGQSCCAGACVANTDTSCACAACDTAAGDSCQVGGGGLIPGMGSGMVSVCCGDESVAILGCGGGFPLPFP